MNIKTWAERAESLSDDTVVTSLHLAQFKQSEIDELRQENARLKSALLTNDTTIESANNAAGMLEAENARLRDALLKLYAAAPTTLDCRSFHHSKKEEHSAFSECKPARDYLKSLEAARAALGES